MICGEARIEMERGLNQRGGCLPLVPRRDLVVESVGLPGLMSSARDSGRFRLAFIVTLASREVGRLLEGLPAKGACSLCRSGSACSCSGAAACAVGGTTMIDLRLSRATMAVVADSVRGMMEWAGWIRVDRKAVSCVAMRDLRRWDMSEVTERPEGSSVGGRFMRTLRRPGGEGGGEGLGD